MKFSDFFYTLFEKSIAEHSSIVENVEKIEMEELMARKDKLTENKKKIHKIIHETNKQIGKAPKDDKINFVLDTKQAALVKSFKVLLLENQSSHLSFVVV